MKRSDVLMILEKEPVTDKNRIRIRIKESKG